jgi:hypothetical protein
MKRTQYGTDVMWNGLSSVAVGVGSGVSGRAGPEVRGLAACVEQASGPRGQGWSARSEARTYDP